MDPLNMSLLANLIETKDARIKELEAENRELMAKYHFMMGSAQQNAKERDQLRNRLYRYADSDLEERHKTFDEEISQLRELCRELRDCIKYDAIPLDDKRLLEKADAILGAENE